MQEERRTILLKKMKKKMIFKNSYLQRKEYILICKEIRWDIHSPLPEKKWEEV